MSVSASPRVDGRGRRALARILRDRAALLSLAVLAVVASACLAGPSLTGHEPGRVYPDLRQLPAGFTAQPDATRLGPALDRLAFRMRAHVADLTGEGNSLRLTLTAEAGVDRRSLVYLPRSSLFGAPRVVEESDGGRRLVVDVPVWRLRFLLGTDVHGRDLLTRCLVAGRVSLLIGLAVPVVYGTLAFRVPSSAAGDR